MRIRPATLTDREDCLAIARMYPATKSFLAPWYSGLELFVDSEDIYVLDDGGIAGFYSARFGRRSNIVALEYVAVAVPGNGLGSELVDHLQWRVRLSGTHDTIRTKITRRALTFWRKNRFEIDGDRAIWST